jgi:hypothetical protein
MAATIVFESGIAAHPIFQHMIYIKVLKHNLRSYFKLVDMR